MKVTIQDIADELGVSRNTVSKAINNSEGIADATRERILQKAVEMGYKQLSYALSMRPQDNSGSASAAPEFKGEIALFSQIFLDSSHFASLMMDKLQQEMALLGYTINTHRVTEDNIANMTLPITFIRERACAILCIEMFNWEYCEMVCNLEMPTLFVDGPVKFKGRSLPCDQLYMNNSDEITRFVNDMVEAGCKTIGFIGNYDHCQSFYERYIAYRNAVTMNGLKFDEKYFIYFDEDPAKKLPRLKEQLAVLDELPDVFVCSNDFSAIDAIQILRELGKDVPRDVKILGFDDSEESRKFNPPLTTIHIHTQVMAFSALQLLVSRMKQPWLDNRIVYTQCDLIYRESAKID